MTIKKIYEELQNRFSQIINKEKDGYDEGILACKSILKDVFSGIDDRKVLTTTELVARWEVNRDYIINLVENGFLNCFNNTGSGSHKRFAIAYVEKIEEQGGIEPAMYDVLKIKRLQNELERKDNEIKELKKMVDALIANALTIKQKINS